MSETKATSLEQFKKLARRTQQAVADVRQLAQDTQFQLDASNANGLVIGKDGLKLDLATAVSAGAMSAEDKAKLDSISMATDEEVDAALDEIFGGSES